jgi:hypothetical protein
MLLAALPVREAPRLVNLSASGPNPGSQWCTRAGDCDVVFSYPMFRDLEKAQTPFTGVAAHWVNNVNVAYGDHTNNTQAAFVSGQYFPVLGVTPELGRLLGPSDDQESGVVRHLDPTLPIEEMRTVPEQVRNNVFLDRLLGSLAFAFAALATLLAAVGLYGVLAYSVAQRTREIGVRMALGADAGRIGRMVLRQVGVMTLVGAPIGIAGAIALRRGARSILFGLEGTDPIAIGGAAGILAIVALAAGYLPAHRASRVDPVKAIRYE